jgi:Protein of unknown function (DUF3105)
MSSRQEEKERRRQERMAAEEAAKRSAARRKRMGIVAGGVLAAAIAVVIVLAVVSGGDEGANQAQGDVVAPTFEVTNLQEAARAADCRVQSFRIEGRGHTSRDVQYRTNPPTSGEHDPTPADDGVYAPNNPPDKEASVHSLEHGRILIQYKAGTPQQRIDQLQAVFAEEVKGTEGYHTLLFQNQTNMEPALAVTAWGRSLTCPAFNDRVFDAIRAFRTQNVDKGPEFIP